MKLDFRLVILCGVLAIGAATDFLFVRYLEAAGEMRTVLLQAPLTDVPRQIGDWVGDDVKAKEEQLYGDDHLYRSYRNLRTGQRLSVWMVYSKVGEDRAHHPDVCQKVAGKLEDVSMNRTFEVPGHPEPVQQYRYYGNDGAELVYYWHYGMEPLETTTVSDLQRRYQRFHKRPSSITIEVFAPHKAKEDVTGAQDFVREIDREMQRFVGRDAVRGSSRVPVVVVDPGANQH